MHLTRFRILALSALLAALTVPGAAHAGCLPDTIPDDAYIGILDGNDSTGTDAGMLCCPYNVDPGFPGEVSDVNVTLAVTHGYVGDLVIKLKSPTGTVTTLQSRSGLAEVADNGVGACCASGADWAGATIRYDEQPGGPSAETMGAGLGENGKVCTDNGVCSFTPNTGSGPGGRLDTVFDGETHIGNWELCIGDSDILDVGTWNSYDVQVVVDRSIPCSCGGKFRGGDHVRYAPGVAPDTDRTSAAPGMRGVPPNVGAAGVVMCGNGGGLLVSWTGFTSGYSGQGLCTCPTGSMPIGTTSGFLSGCQDIDLDLPWSDDFETGNTNHWSSSAG